MKLKDNISQLLGILLIPLTAFLWLGGVVNYMCDDINPSSTCKALGSDTIFSMRAK